MKKIVPVFLLAVAAAFFISCASTAQEPEEPVVTTTEPEPVAKEEAPPPPPPAKTDARRDVTGIIIEGAKTYTVKRGDTLSNIAKTHYGAENGYYFPLIMMASDNRIVNPDVIDPNNNFIIPDLEANLADPEAREKMKVFFAVVAESYNGKNTPRAAQLREEINKISRSL